MKPRAFALAVFLLLGSTGLAFAQRGGGGGAWRAPGASGAGFGSILFPGGAPGHPQVVRPAGSIVDTSFGSALGATIRGVPPPHGPRPGGVVGGGVRGGGGGGYYRGGFGFGGGGGRTVVVPYPVMVGAPAYYPYGYGYDPQFAVPADMVQYVPQQVQQPPVVIINQNYKPDTVTPVVREYPSLPEPQAQQQQEQTLKVYENRSTPAAAPRQVEDDKPTIFLIALKEGNIMPALAMWVEGDTLHYITRESSHNKISLDRIDRDFSIRLNRERGLEFRIP